MLGEADYDITQSAFSDPTDRGNINPADYENMLVKFVHYPMQNRSKSKEEGRPIFEEVVYVDIRTPGDRTSHIFRPAADIDKRKWPKHWEAFQTRVEGDSEEVGTPLEEWPAITRSLVQELKFFNVYTVEALANLSDTACGQFMGINEWKTRAQAYIALSQDSAVGEEFAAELETLKSTNTVLQQANAALMARLEKLEAAEADED